jgi:hypothetical protein
MGVSSYFAILVADGALDTIARKPKHDKANRRDAGRGRHP